MNERNTLNKKLSNDMAELQAKNLELTAYNEDLRAKNTKLTDDYKALQEKYKRSKKRTTDNEALKGPPAKKHRARSGT